VFSKAAAEKALNLSADFLIPACACGFPKVPRINEEISENLSTPMALGNNSICVLVAFENSFVTALAAF
jgi:hypothetical protein